MRVRSQTSRLTDSLTTGIRIEDSRCQVRAKVSTALTTSLMWLAVLLGTGADTAHAEIYQGITPNTTLGDLRVMYPGGKFLRVKAAWVTERDALYDVSGAGIAGRMLIAFHDIRPTARDWLKAPKTKAGIPFMRKLATQSDNDALTVEWVRWVPDAPIPADRFEAKYGKSEHGYDDSDMTPFRKWPNRGVHATLSDDELFVLYVEFNFTDEERRQATARLLRQVEERGAAMRRAQATPSPEP